MSGERFHSLPPSLPSQQLRASPFFILIKDGINRIDSRLTANKGDIFQYDPESDGTFPDISKIEKKKPPKHKKILLRAINAKKVKVEWDSANFAPLTDEEKKLLEAIESPKCRFMTYTDPDEYLTFGCLLKKGEMVQVKSSALSKSKSDIHGVLMHKGPLFQSKSCDAKGTWFGVKLSSSCGKCSGKYKGYTYFTCDSNCAVFVTIDKLVPVHKFKKPGDSHRQKENVRSQVSASDGLGIDGAAKPLFFKEGMKVEVEAFLKDFGKQRIEGMVVDSKTDNGETFVAVKVGEHHHPLINTHGIYRGRSIFPSNSTAYTVTVPISDVHPLESTKSHYLKDEGRKAEERGACNVEDDVWSKQETQKEQRGLYGTDSAAQCHTTGGNKLSSNGVGRPDHSSEGNTDSQMDIKNIVENVGLEMKTNLDKTPPTSPVITRSPSNQDINFHDDHYKKEAVSERPPGTSSGRNHEEQKKRKHTEPTKSFLSIAAIFPFRSVEQPSFPLEDWCLGQISIGGEDLLRNIAYDLQIREANQIFRRGKDIYDITSQLLKHWWDQLNEGHKTALLELKDSLRRNKFGELVYYMDGGQPTDGAVHPSIIEVVLCKIGNRLPRFVDKLGVTVTAEELAQSGEQVFHIWQKKHPGTEKLSKLVSAIKDISREISQREQKEQSVGKAAELEELGDELEQGLSESVIRGISSTVPKEEWYQLGYSLGLSQLRLNAMERKFVSLSHRVFHVLRYWQMIQPYEVDQAEKLIVALESCGLQQNVHLISKGLDEERLLRVSESIGDKWKIFAGIVFGPSEIHHLLQSTERDQDKALSALRKWKRKQPATHKDLKKKLCEDLKKCKLFKAARTVLDGLDPEVFYSLARFVVFDWQPLAKMLDFENYEIGKLENMGFPEQSAYEMLLTWNETNDRDTGRKRKLCDALKQIGLEDVANWLQNTEEDVSLDDINNDPGNKNPVTAKNPEPEVKKIDQVLLSEIATKLKDCGADVSILKEFLELSAEDINKCSPKTVTYDSDPYLFNLLAWRRKMRNLKKGTQEIGFILQEALSKCGLEDAANFISAGTPVDFQGAVGGSSASQAAVSKENLYVNSLVEFIWSRKTYHGTIQWIGDIAQYPDHGRIAGIETEESLQFGGNYELFLGRKYFNCDLGRGIFLPLSRCQPDSRFPTESQTLNEYTKTSKEDFGNIDCDPIPGYQEPQTSVSEDLVGLFKGIQGDHNSCYMDVTLYSMFAYSDIFDKILGWPKGSEQDSVQLIKDHLRESIVNPLRSKGVVRADYILQFREMLNELSSMKGLRTEEKDPEEFIHTLLQELLNADPFLKISQGEATTMESFVYQIFLEKNDFFKVPTVEQLVHLSFLESDLKLVEVPKCFIVQLPRFGKQFKLYDWIIPSLEMNITPIVKNSTRPCSVCGELALAECKDCRPKIKSDEIIQSFCVPCWKQKHKENKEKMFHHIPVTLLCQKEFMEKYSACTHNGADPTAAQHLYDNHKMELFSVMCIETSHYVAFVKTGSGKDSQWVFFDSMADRRGDHRGYNVPEVTHICSFQETVESKSLIEDLKMPNFPSCMKRLFGDAYICFYRLVSSTQSPVTTHCSESTFQGNPVEAFKGNGQKTYYGEESYQSSTYPSDVDMLDSLQSENLINTPVYKPPSTETGERYEVQSCENSAVGGEEPMEVNFSPNTNDRLPPNTTARFKRYETASTVSNMASGHQNSGHHELYTSNYTYNVSAIAPPMSNFGMHDTGHTSPSHRGSRKNNCQDDREEYV